MPGKDDHAKSVDAMRAEFDKGVTYVIPQEFEKDGFWYSEDTYDKPITDKFIVDLERRNSRKYPLFTLRHIPHQFHTDELCKFYALELKMDCIGGMANEKLAKDRDFIVSSIKANPINVSGLQHFKDDVDLFRLANAPNNGVIFLAADETIKTNKSLIKEFIPSNPDCLQYASDDLREDNQFMWECYKINPTSIKYLRIKRTQSNQHLKLTEAISIFIAEMERKEISNTSKPRKETELEAKARRKRQSGM